jgi:hypothetical protein
MTLAGNLAVAAGVPGRRVSGSLSDFVRGICGSARAGGYGAAPAGVRPVWWSREMDVFAGVSRVPADS